MSKKKTSKAKRTGKVAKAGRRAATSAKGGKREAKAAKAAENATRAKRGGEGGKRMGALDAAAQVLKKAGKPMNSKALIASMAEHGLWTSPAGKTPHATLYAAMLREIGAKANAARFKKVERGLFAFSG